jgi:glutaredoxin 3
MGHMFNIVFSMMILLSSPVVVPRINSHPFPSQKCTAQEKPVLVLYYTSYCPYSQKVLRYLQQIHKTIPMKNVQRSSEGRDELLKVGGKLQVPCLVVNGKAIYESDAIIDWLSQHQNSLDPA